ncbi:MAG: hypothetical protein GY785_25580, partial [Gammaproteobacteria bacterium]|nr:hypothetical protein [Gammaproteobacteria bacterium]
MSPTDKFHLARKTPAMTLTDFEPNLDMDKLCRYRLGRVREKLAAQDLAACVLYDPINIRYATGTRNMSVYTMHAAERYAFIATEGPVVIFDSYPVGTPTIVDERRPAQIWYYEVTQDKTFDACQNWAAEIADLVHQYGGGNRRLAIDRMATLGYGALQKHKLTLCDGGSVMEQARLIKSTEELACMSVAVAACDVG